MTILSSIGNGLVSTVVIVFWLLFYLVSTLFWAIVYVLAVLASPFVYVGSLVVHALLLPVHFLAQFNALWSFLSVAVLIGIVYAAVGELIVRTLVPFFVVASRRLLPNQRNTRLVSGRAAAAAVVAARKRGYDAATYRAAREAKKQQQQRLPQVSSLLANSALGKSQVPAWASSYTTTPLSPNANANTKPRSLTRETIVEDSDEDEESEW